MSTEIEKLQKEIEERKAAIAAEEAKLLEAKREAERIEREHAAEIAQAKAKAARKEQRAKYLPDAEKIVAALKVQGFADAMVQSEAKTSDQADFPTILPLGESIHNSIPVSFDYVYDHSSWHYSRNGVKVEVGYSYQEGSKRFPQRKGGDFNYDGIAKAYKELYEAIVAKQERADSAKKAANSNEARIRRLTNKFGKEAYKGADYKNIPNVGIFHYTAYGSGRDYRSVEREDNDLILKVEHISEENATKLLTFMRDNGMLNSN